MKTAADALALAGRYITEDDQILYILAGLGLEYDSIVVNITNCPNPFPWMRLVLDFRRKKLVLSNFRLAQTSQLPLKSCLSTEETQLRWSRFYLQSSFQQNTSQTQALLVEDEEIEEADNGIVEIVHNASFAASLGILSTSVIFTLTLISLVYFRFDSNLTGFTTNPNSGGHSRGQHSAQQSNPPMAAIASASVGFPDTN